MVVAVADGVVVVVVAAVVVASSVDVELTLHHHLQMWTQREV